MNVEPGQYLGHYRIERQIGKGGMGEVYRALDTRLDRNVALKVLPSEMASNPARLERFQREAKIVAGLNHPHIVTLFSVEEDKGIHFLTMELVEGQGLETLIPESGLPLEKVFEVGIAVADALATAHNKGIVHRDLKPANVMVTKDSRVKVLDFGLAKLIETAESGDSATKPAPVTGEGVVLGTLPYMSPEQLRGQEVDERSDIFSLGVMLYQLTTGRRPFGGATNADVSSSILSAAPPLLQYVKPDLPRHLGRIISHCLEKDPQDRYQSALDIRNELRGLRREVESGVATGSGDEPAKAPVSVRPSDPVVSTPPVSSIAGRSSRTLWIGIAAAILVVGTFAMVFLWRDLAQPPETASPSAQTATGADSPSIAVLPFVNMSSDPEQEYFADGLAEELMGMLSRVPQLKVPARTSSFYFKGKQATVAEIAQTLGVAHVLEGSVRKSGDQLRVSAQLIRAADGFQLWSETFDRRLDDVFKVQDEIANAVVRALELKLLEADLPKATPTHSQEAYSLFLQARSLHYRGTHADNLTGISYLERALELDPTFPPAWFGLGDAMIYDYVVFGAGTFKEVRRRAGEAAENAVRLDPNSADSHVLMARVLGDLDWNWPATDREIRRGLELDPKNMLLLWQASVYALVGDRLDDALRFAQRVVDVDAVSWGSYLAIGDVQWRMGRVSDAEASYRKATELSPTSSPLHTWLGITLLRQGRAAEALTEMTQETDEGWRRYGMVLALDALGRRDAADQELAALTRDFADSRPWSIGSLYACRDRLDEAFSWLDRALRQRDGMLPLIKSDPCVGKLEADPRYRALLKKVGLPT